MSISTAPEKIYRIDNGYDCTHFEENPAEDEWAESIEYIRADVIKEMLKEQRQMCARKALALYADAGQWMNSCELEDVIVNATGESDESINTE